MKKPQPRPIPTPEQAVREEYEEFLGHLYYNYGQIKATVEHYGGDESPLEIIKQSVIDATVAVLTSKYGGEIDHCKLWREVFEGEYPDDRIG